MPVAKVPKVIASEGYSRYCFIFHILLDLMNKSKRWVFGRFCKFMVNLRPWRCGCLDTVLPIFKLGLQKSLGAKLQHSEFWRMQRKPLHQTSFQHLCITKLNSQLRPNSLGAKTQGLLPSGKLLRTGIDFAESACWWWLATMRWFTKNVLHQLNMHPLWIAKWQVVRKKWPKCKP